jgi:hypothetical protein
MPLERNDQRLTRLELESLRNPRDQVTLAEKKKKPESVTTIALSDLELQVSNDFLKARLAVPSKKMVGEVVFFSKSSLVLSRIRNTLLDTYSQLPDSDPLKGHSALSQAVAYANSKGVNVSSSVSSIPEEVAALLGDRLLKTISKKRLLMAFDTREIVDGIVLIRLPSPHLLGAAFIRFQELYESPEFAGSHFSMKEYQAWYRTTTSHGGFSYYSDWAGFNVPDYVFAQFQTMGFVPSKLESILLESIGDRTKPFYVIGAVANSDFWGYAQHELAHALYYLDPEYRSDVDTIVAEVKTAQFENALVSSGYDESKLPDELQAYLLDGPQAIRDSYGCSTRGFATASRAIKKRFMRALHQRLSID